LLILGQSVLFKSLFSLAVARLYVLTWAKQQFGLVIQIWILIWNEVWLRIQVNGRSTGEPNPK